MWDQSPKDMRPIGDKMQLYPDWIYLSCDHLLANLATILQNSSKVTPSLVPVFWLTWVLWSISSRSSSLRFSCSCLEMALNSSKLMIPSSSLSNCTKTLFRPSLVLVSPTLEQMMFRNSSKVTGWLASLSPWMRERMKGLLLSRPSSSKTLLISAGSMVPLRSSSKISKVFLSSSQSSALILSFQVVGAEALAGAACWGFAVRLIRYVNLINDPLKIIKFNFGNQVELQQNLFLMYPSLRAQCPLEKTFEVVFRLFEKQGVLYILLYLRQSHEFQTRASLTMIF